MKRVVFVVGHSFYDNGADNKNTGDTEYKFNMEVAHWIMQNEKFKDIDTIIKARNASYGELPEEINSLNPDLVVCLHCNAFNEKVQGTEMLYWYNSKKGKAAAEIFQNHFLEALKLNDRKAQGKKHKENGAPVLSGTKAVCIIGEPFFIDSMDSIDNNLVEKVGRAYLDSVKEVFEKVI